MEVEGKIPPGSEPGGRSAVGIMLADRMRRPTSEAQRRRLSTVVTNRGWSLSVRFGAATALAELCLVDREEAAREAWGLPCRIDLILLIAGGVLGEDLDEFVRATRTHAPRTRIYRWTGTEIVPIDRGLLPPPDGSPERDDEGSRTATQTPPDRPDRPDRPTPDRGERANDSTAVRVRGSVLNSPPSSSPTDGGSARQTASVTHPVHRNRPAR